METNPLGKSIVKAAWIISGALIFAMAIYYFAQPKYTPLGDVWYIENSTGKVMLAPAVYESQNK